MPDQPNTSSNGPKIRFGQPIPDQPAPHSPIASRIMGGEQTPHAAPTMPQQAAPDSDAKEPQAAAEQENTEEHKPGCGKFALIALVAIGAAILGLKSCDSVEERRADRNAAAEAQYGPELKQLASRDSADDIKIVDTYMRQNACFERQITSRLSGEGHSSNATCPRTDKKLDGNMTPTTFQVRSSDASISGKGHEYSISHRITVVPLAYGLTGYRSDNAKAVDAALVKYDRTALEAFNEQGQKCAIVYSARVARHTEITERYDTVTAELGTSVSIGCLTNGKFSPVSVPRRS